MFVINVMYNNESLENAFMSSYNDMKEYILNWSQKKNHVFGRRVKMHEFCMNVYDISKPCLSNEEEKPTYIYY